MKSMINSWRAGLLGAALAAGINASASAEALDSIVAVVNNNIILASDLDVQVDQAVTELSARGTSVPNNRRLRRQVLERLILGELQLQIAEQAGIKITDDQLARTLRNIATDNQLSLAQFRQALAEEGLSYQQFSDDLRKQMTINRLRQSRINSKVKVTPEEVDRFITNQPAAMGRESVKLRHILIATPEGASTEQIGEAQAQAESLRDQLQQGADFAALAAEYSDSPTALEGGDLGWRPVDQVPTLFETLAVELEKGQVSPIIPSSGGFHLVMMEDVRGDEPTLVTQTRARHILIRTDELVSDNDARSALATLRARIVRGGEDFADLARAHSADPGSSIKGGDLGWINPGDVAPAFELEMAALGNNEISEPFETQFGWHLVQVLERREFDNSEQATREQARLALRKRKADDEIDLWLRRLREEAYVEIRL